MLIGVFTEKWDSNYGGIIQAAALQRALNQLGHDVIVLDRRAADFRAGSLRFKDRFRHLLERTGARRPFVRLRLKGLSLSAKQRAIARQRRPQQSFILRNINLSHLCRHPVSMRDISRIAADAYVVGSDQVWRCAYQPSVHDSFLGFLPSEIRKRSVAYAASFGKDAWEGSPEETAACRRLLQDFKAVSVREESGMDICRQALGRNAELMPDPTLLLTPDDYLDMCGGESPPPARPYIAYYILDMTEGICRRLRALSEASGLPIKDVMFDIPPEKRRDKDRQTPYRSVEEWLRLVRHARHVVTDSFHGTVFSILFRRDFTCLRNARRGNARFETLFRQLGVECPDAPVQEAARLHTVSTAQWERVGAELARLRAQGRSFLERNLNFETKGKTK